jgi:flagellar L-ring protein precursor FlgH
MGREERCEMRTIKRTLLTAAVLTAACLAFGCAQKTPPASPLAAVDDSLQKKSSLRPLFKPEQASEGSLWTDSGNALFEDKKARRVGDTVVVDIVENSSSQLDANTTSDRESIIEAGIPNLLGYKQPFKLTNSKTTAEPLFNANFKTEFEGTGTTDRTGRVTASVAARITEVLPNGNLVIFGRKEMKVSNESQYITVAGLCRPEDVDSANRIQSTFLADSRIEYSGEGVISDKQKPGWLTRALEHVWPF